MIRVLFVLILLGGSFAAKQPAFDPQILDTTVAIGYGLAIGDVDGDRKPDILLADKKQFVWYRNGDWKRFVMVEDLTTSDNVCIAARDIDGDGKVEVAVGAQWNPSETSDTLTSGSVHYLIRPEDPTQKWTPVELHHEPTIHRMKWVRTGQDTYQLVVVPLHGRGNKNGEGEFVKIYAYERPAASDGVWKYSLVDASMHMTHNFDVVDVGGASEVLWIGSKEGMQAFEFKKGQGWRPSERQIRDRGFGEVRRTGVRGNMALAAISPMHGNELRIYSSDGKSSTLLTADLNQGHALACADLLGSGSDQLVVGWREPNSEKKVGIKMYVHEGRAWRDYWIDDNGMACEDLQLADLDGDGKKDIIAAGRATHNLKVYWNRTR